MTTHDVLRKARAYLLEHGWQQGDYGIQGGRRCALGAIKSARDPDTYVSDEHPAVLALGDVVEDQFVCRWNDEDGRTLDEVIAAFDKAIIQTAPSSPADQGGTASRSVGEAGSDAVDPTECPLGVVAS